MGDQVLPNKDLFQSVREILKPRGTRVVNKELCHSVRELLQPRKEARVVNREL